MENLMIYCMMLNTKLHLLKTTGVACSWHPSAQYAAAERAIKCLLTPHLTSIGLKRYTTNIAPAVLTFLWRSSR